MEKGKDLEINQIIKYLNGELSEEETALFNTWLKEKENRELFKQYAVTDHYVQLGKNDFDKDKAFSNFIQKKNNTRGFISRLGQYTKYAAAIVGIAFCTTFFTDKTELKLEDITTEISLELSDGSVSMIKVEDTFKEIKDENGMTVSVQKGSKLTYQQQNELEEVIINTLRVPKGRKLQIELSDGTIVHINAGSTLTFPSSFIAGTTRKVSLEGEAYFKVAKNPEDAFIVATNGINTEVFGTEFNVSSYANDSFSEVVLIEGSVGVFKDKERFDQHTDKRLSPNQKARISSVGKKIKISQVDVSQYIAWIDNILLFKNESFENIMKKLERSYDVEITINNETIKKEKFTGQFDTESIENVLNTFRSNTLFSYEIKENQIIINP
ncbi:FecR family protein [Aquimarina hainanensis]|uniref:FecR family protein n=1 Tax=Aquimarina hainanensis TaxID=1578017 RepID=A0ABW5N5Q5_9FLAO|nr:FecR family protein [Aquimarina sp. TRL1]QKX06240.1 FecR family protein [Aquimarina sp. TRL1]